MPRNRRSRKVVAPPQFKGYKPYGNSIAHTNEVVELLYEEYEAIKLADYDQLKHDEASEKMGISRPTFARIYASARQKVAQAMVEAKEIRAVYGNAVFDKTWYFCNDCFVRFTIPINKAHHICPICKSNRIEILTK